ncbi:phenylacetate--CoA ligase family protein [Chloroflexota bacterium]
MYSAFVNKVLFPSIEFVERRHFLSILDWYNKCQYLPYEELKIRQEEKLRRLVHHAYENVPYYRKRFDSFGIGPEDIHTLQDLPKIPITTRIEIRRNFPSEMIAKNIPASRCMLMTTSGSTGTPLAFYLDKASKDYTRASFLLFLHWAGIKPGDRSVWIGGALQQPLKTRVSNILQRRSRISVHDLTVPNMEFWLQSLARMKPAFIAGQALAIFRLARAAINFGIDIRPKAVVSTGETMPSREVVEQAFRCPVFDRYGNMEMDGFLAQNCLEGTSLYVNTELCILEVIDSQGNNVKPGEVGKIVLTDLTNNVMPFIRYDPQDLARAGSKCPCGRGFPLISNIEGRSTEALLTPNGQVITPIILGWHLFRPYGYVDYFLKYQAEQNEPDRITFRFVPLKPINEGVRRRLYNDLRELLGEEVEINLEFVDDIPLEASGKQLVIKSSLSIR